MSYQPMPAEPESQGQHPAARGAPPQSVQRAVVLIWVNIALSVLSFLLTFVYLDESVEDAVASAEASGLQVDADAARIGAIVFGVILFLVFGALYVLLAIFIRKGANWARIVWTVLAAIGILVGLFGLFGEQPVLLLIIGLVSLVITVVVLVLLWMKDSNAYFRGPTTPRQV